MKATLLGVATGFGALALAFGLSLPLRATSGTDPERAHETNATLLDPALTSSSSPRQGEELFERNCAHCHGDDARGDEGPNLHNLRLSDAKIANRIKEGIKGEMPRFGSKLNDGETQDLIAYLRTLKE